MSEKISLDSSEFYYHFPYILNHFLQLQPYFFI